MKKRQLGKGLGALIGTPGAAARGYVTVPIEKIAPSPSQPRREFDDRSLDELAASIREQGIIQPLILRRSGDGYTIVAGERRWRAAQRVGLREVPAIVKDVEDRDALEMALVENLQREDLNPIEEARAYELLIREYGLTHETISARIGKDRSTITNQLRLLKLPPSVQQALMEGRINAGHARALLSLESPQKMEEALATVIKEKLSVRKTESYVKRLNSPRPSRSSQGAVSPYVRHLADELMRALGTKVTIRQRGGKGLIEIEFYSQDELERLIETLAGRGFSVTS